MIARNGTAEQLDRLVSKYRRAERIEAAADAQAQHRRRFVHYTYDDDGMLVIAARLPPEIGELVKKALEAAVEELYQDGVQAKRAELSVGAENPRVDAEDAHVEDAAASAESATVETPKAPEQIERPENAKRVDRAPELEARADASAEAPAEEREGEDRMETFGTRRADALRLIAETFLASGANHTDTTADRYQVVVHIDQALLASGPMLDASSEPTTETTESASSPGTRSLFDRCELEDGQALALETARRLACDAALIGIVDDENGEPLSVGRRTRAISPALRRALRARDGGCRFPGCDRRRFTAGHHVEHWANGGETKLSNLVSVCGLHHRLIHEGGFGVRKAEDGTFVFLRPDGQPLPESGRLGRPTLDALTDAAARGVVALRELNRARGLRIDRHTAAAGDLRIDRHTAAAGDLRIDRHTAAAGDLRIDRPTAAAGERLDYDMAVDNLGRHRSQAETR